MSGGATSEKGTIWHPVCQVEDIPRHGARTVHTGDAVIALFRLIDDRIRAVDNRCPHKQGPLAEGIISGEVVICPLHARKINLENGEVLAPDSGCVRTFPVRIERGRVLLSLE